VARETGKQGVMTTVSVYVDGDWVDISNHVVSVNTNGAVSFFEADNLPITENAGINYFIPNGELTLYGSFDTRYLNHKTRKYLQRYRRRGEQMRKGKR
jgi:hypothetical protein